MEYGYIGLVGSATRIGGKDLSRVGFPLGSLEY